MGMPTVFLLICILYLVIYGERVWPNPPKFLDIIADDIILQQLDHLTFPIICDLVEKDVFTLVSIYIYIFIRLKIKPNSVRIRF
jgi:hypothetical protein